MRRINKCRWHRCSSKSPSGRIRPELRSMLKSRIGATFRLRCGFRTRPRIGVLSSLCVRRALPRADPPTARNSMRPWAWPSAVAARRTSACCTTPRRASPSTRSRRRRRRTSCASAASRHPFAPASATLSCLTMPCCQICSSHPTNTCTHSSTALARVKHKMSAALRDVVVWQFQHSQQLQVSHKIHAQRQDGQR